jgi:4'-phosphopantetheinyl transferase
VSQWTNNAVHCWTATVQEITPLATCLLPFLSADERERWLNYRLETRRQQFLVSRGLLRFLLSRYLRCQPQDLEFQYSEHGKPALSNTIPSRIQFNIAHSQDWVLFAFSQTLELGVDIEVLEPNLNYKAIAHRFLRQEEGLAFQEIEEHSQQLAFYRIWSRKEAVIKLWGDNLFQGLQLYPVPTAPSVDQHQILSRDKTVWLRDLDINANFAAALATFAEPSTIEYRDCIKDGGIPEPDGQKKASFGDAD